MGLRLKFILPLLFFAAVALLYVHVRGAGEPGAPFDGAHASTPELAAALDELSALAAASEWGRAQRALSELLVSRPGWLSAELLDARGRSIQRAGGGAMPAAVYAWRRPLVHAQRQVGTLVLTLDASTDTALPGLGHPLLFLGVVLFAFIVVSALALELGVRRPLRRLARAATRLAQGDFTVPLPRVGAGEVDALARSFDSVREAMRRYQSDLSFQATHDPLTGLVNRREFERRVGTALSRAKSECSQHALLYMDLDQFKVVNDTGGHTAGDEYLRQLSVVLGAGLRKHDTLARLGGDEFGVLLEHCPPEQTLRIADQLRERIQDFRFLWEGKSFTLGVSVGVVFLNEYSESLSRVLNVADAACCAAKDDGRNRVHVYREDDSTILRRHGEMQWVSRITEAVEQGRFHLYYQPIVPVGARAEEGAHFEFLLRMEDHGGRIVAPRAFLHAAERYNMMLSLDRWVTQTALNWLEEHPEKVTVLGLCTINLSGHSLGDAEFLQFMIKQIQRDGVPAEKICFEITETAAIGNLTKAVRFMSILRNLGCRFSLDDFGTGMSSFAYLKNLPVDYLKIDGLFVKDIADDPIDYAMVKSINEMGHVMGKRTVAEFVEKEPILLKLREIGVDYAQGYSIARPRPLIEMDTAPFLRDMRLAGNGA